MRMSSFILFILGALFFSLDVNASTILEKKIRPEWLFFSKAPVSSIEVVKVYPHDANAFTQGLFFQKGRIYESTGLYGKSILAVKDLQTGKAKKKITLASGYFGEGAVSCKGQIYQLTWQNETLIIYDAKTLREIKKIKYSGEGWGITTDGKHLFMSNGSSMIAVRDPDSFNIIGEINVYDQNTPIDRLNELEFVQGEIWANIFMEDKIVRIDPKSGKVKGWVDLEPLRAWLPDGVQVDVLNGIAYDDRTGRIFVTGKFWPKLFEIRLLK